MADDPSDRPQLIGELAGLLKLARRPVPSERAALRSTRAAGVLALDEEGEARFGRLVGKLVSHQHFEHLGREGLRDALLDTLAGYQTGVRQGRRSDAKQVVAAFIQRTARQPEHASVFLGVRRLNLPGTLDVGIARFVPAAEVVHLTSSTGQGRGEDCSTYCVVDASGGTEDALIERAAHRAVSALSLLRLQLRHGVRSLHRHQLRFELHGAYIIMPADGPPRRGFRWGREPISLDLPPALLSEVVASVAAEGRAIQALRPPFRARVDTTLEWMDVAARSPSWKTQIPAIFSGVESLLVPEDCGHKAEVVTVRGVALQIALDQGFYHPAETYFDYLVRGYLVHGAPLEVDTTGDLQRRAEQCARWAREIISAYVTYASRASYPDAPALVRGLDRSEAAQKACDWLSKAGLDEIVRAYRKVLGLPSHDAVEGTV